MVAKSRKFWTGVRAGSVAARCVIALQSLGNAVLCALRKCLWPRTRPASAASICVFRPAALGDLVVAIPAIYAIRRAYPSAKITLVTWPEELGKAESFKLLDGADWIDEILVYHRGELGGLRGKLPMIRDLRRRRFDIWFEIPPAHWSLSKLLVTMLAARIAGAKWAYGWRSSSIGAFAQAQSEWLDLPTQVERLLRIVAEAGIPCDFSPQWPLPATRTHRNFVADLIDELGLTSRRLVALAPCAGYPANLWPRDRFVSVGRALVADGRSVAVLGGAADSAVCESVANEIGAGAASFAGRLSLVETCVLLEKCRLLVALDSGPQHLAAAMGTPCISLFSCRDVRGEWRPWGESSFVIQKWVDCHTCRRRECPFDNRCMKLINVDEVIELAGKVLRSRNGHASTGISPGFPRSALPMLRVSSARADSTPA